MNLLVLSDSHGRTSRILEALSRQVQRPDAVVFLGDGLRDLAYADLVLPIYAVAGNCDVYTAFAGLRAEEEILVSLEGKRIMMTHGDAYGVKSGLGRLIMAAKRKEVDIVLFGHTHVALEQYLPAGDTDYGITLDKPIYLFNPGSIGGFDGSFGCLTVTQKGVLLSHGTLS